MKEIFKTFLVYAAVIGVIVLLEVLFLTTKHYALCLILVGVIVALAGISQAIGWNDLGKHNKKEQEKHFKK